LDAEARAFVAIRRESGVVLRLIARNRGAHLLDIDFRELILDELIDGSSIAESLVAFIVLRLIHRSAPCEILVRIEIPYRAPVLCRRYGIFSEKRVVLEYDLEESLVDVILDELRKCWLYRNLRMPHLHRFAVRTLEIRPEGHHDRCVRLTDKWLTVNLYEHGVIGMGAPDDKFLFALGLERQRQRNISTI